MAHFFVIRWGLRRATMVHCFFSVMCMSLCVPWFLFTSKHSPEKKKNACSCFKHACVCVRYCCVRLVRKKLVLPGVAQTLFRFVEHGCQALLDVCMLGMCASYAVWIDYSFRKSYFYAKNSGFPLWIQLEDEAQSWLVACPYPSDAQNFGILLKHV